MGAFGGFCEYCGDKFIEIICPGIDINCFSPKMNGCELFQGYKARGGIINYFSWQIAQLRNKEDDVSELEGLLSEALAYLKKKNFIDSNEYLGNLMTKIDEANNKIKNMRIYLLR